MECVCEPYLSDRYLKAWLVEYLYQIATFSGWLSIILTYASLCDICRPADLLREGNNDRELV